MSRAGDIQIQDDATGGAVKPDFRGFIHDPNSANLPDYSQAATGYPNAPGTMTQPYHLPVGSTAQPGNILTLVPADATDNFTANHEIVRLRQRDKELKDEIAELKEALDTVHSNLQDALISVEEARADAWREAYRVLVSGITNTEE